MLLIDPRFSIKKKETSHFLWKTKGNDKFYDLQLMQHLKSKNVLNKTIKR